MKKLVRSLGLFSLMTLSTLAAHAAPDLVCFTSGVMDAGFEVTADRVGENSYRLHVQTISGFGTEEVLVDGPASIERQPAGDLSLVRISTNDSAKNKRTVVQLLPGKKAQLELLNGKKPTGLFANLKCEFRNDSEQELGERVLR